MWKKISLIFNPYLLNVLILQFLKLQLPNILNRDLNI